MLSLSACLPLPGQKQEEIPAPVQAQVQEEDPAMLLFIDGVDHFDSNHRSDAFMQLAQQFADSPWNRRAKVLASLAGSIRLLEKQIERQQALIEGQKSDHLDLIEFKQENDLLREQINILKALIIDLELRQP